jgi:hypothetical protein
MSSQELKSFQKIRETRALNSRLQSIDSNRQGSGEVFDQEEIQKEMKERELNQMIRDREIQQLYKENQEIADEKVTVETKETVEMNHSVEKREKSDGYLKLCCMSFCRFFKL